MHPVLFRITETIAIRSYGVMLAIAFFVGIIIAIRFAKREGIKSSVVIDLSLWVILATIIGGRLLYVLMNLKDYLSSPLDILRIWQGGLIFYGGFFLSILVAVWFFKRNKINEWRGLDLLSPAAAIGYAIARIGCFLNGCCYGKPTDGPFGLIFSPESAAGSHYFGVPIHPTQLYAMVINLAIFFVLWYVYSRRRFYGQVFWSYVFLYSVYRFLIEFVRGDKGQIAFGMTAIQLVTIALFVCSIIGYLELRRGETID
ncbi:MAG: prolipoprotein diacylglyceryl transferase [Candidatus Coatesbacteria bacterium]|nr:MAG: prolipoprotein diacylglyceryl transferase [Candidatus Coatesbacteria bacterium]RLC44163.1 MAG: prolipoprotein diacylglyceryl transferase [Candidatus Coatesbacteria bacterium]